MITLNIRTVIHLGCTLVVNFILSVAVIGAGSNNSGEIPLTVKEMLIELKASDSAWRDNEKMFRTMRDTNLSSEVEIEEFASFVAGLQRQMLEDCKRYRDLGGEPIKHGLDCGQGPNESPELVLAIPNSADTQTEQEKIDALESELRALEGELDNLFLREQEALRSRGRPEVSGGTFGENVRSDTVTSAPNSNPPSSGSGSGTAETGKTRGAAGKGRKSRERGAGSAGKDRVVKPEQKGQSPSAIPTGDDDNIVARQLREAAEKETDPVLKKKLWDEYQKYKSAVK
jgi:hypothetical protein